MPTMISGCKPALRLKTCHQPQLSIFTALSNAISTEPTCTSESETSELEEPLRRVLRSSMNFSSARTRSCRYFSKGCCWLGDSCNFLHDVPITAPHVVEDDSETGRGVVWDRRPATQSPDIHYGRAEWSESYFPYNVPPYNFHPLGSASFLPQQSPDSLFSELDAYVSLYPFSDPSSAVSRSSMSPVVSDTVIEDSIHRETATPDSFSRASTSHAPEYLPDDEVPFQSNSNSDASGSQSTLAHLSRFRTIDPPAGPTPCKFFWKTTCKKGNLCKYSHDERSMGSSGDNLTSRRRSALGEGSTAAYRDRNTRSSNDFGHRTVRLAPSVPKRDPSPVKMQSDKWRVVGGGVMLGTTVSKPQNQTRQPGSRRGRKHLQISLSDSGGEQQTTASMRPPNQSQPNHVRSPLPVKSTGLSLIEEEEPLVVSNSSLTSGREDMAAAIPVRPLVVLPLPDEICRPKTTPPSLKPSSTQLPVFLHSELF